MRKLLLGTTALAAAARAVLPKSNFLIKISLKDCFIVKKTVSHWLDETPPIQLRGYAKTIGIILIL